MKKIKRGLQKVGNLPQGLYGLMLVLPNLVFLVGICAIPFFYAFFISFFKLSPFAPPQFVGLANYFEALKDSDFHFYFANTLKYTAGSITLAFAISLITALTLNNIRRVVTLSRIIAVLPWTVPMVVAALVFKWIFTTDYGVINDLLLRLGIISGRVSWLARSGTAMRVLIFADAWIRLGFMIVLLLAGLQSIPQEVYEAARVDGAGTWGRFRYITIPYLRPAMLSALLVQTMFSFRAVAIVYSLTQGGPGDATRTFPLYIYDTVFETMRFGYAAALSIIMTGCIFLIVGFYLWIFKER